MFTQMVQQITQTVREVHLTVYWRDGTQVESLDLVTHVVSLGPGSDRNGGFQPSSGTQPDSMQNQWVNPTNCLIVQNPVAGPGGMVDPATGQQLMRRMDCIQQRTGGGIPPGGQPGRAPQ
jgi:general secretion pathway protein I